MLKAVRPAHRAARGVRRWVLAVFVLLLMATFGGGFLVRSATQGRGEPLAPAWVVRLVDRSFAALGSGSGARLEATYTRDAVLTDMQTGEQWFGAGRLTRHLLALDGLVVHRTSGVVYEDGYATYTFRFGDGYSSAPAVMTVKIEDGRISHSWVMSDEPGGLDV